MTLSEMNVPTAESRVIAFEEEPFAKVLLLSVGVMLATGLLCSTPAWGQTKGARSEAEIRGAASEATASAVSVDATASVETIGQGVHGAQSTPPKQPAVPRAARLPTVGAMPALGHSVALQPREARLARVSDTQLASVSEPGRLEAATSPEALSLRKAQAIRPQTFRAGGAVQVPVSGTVTDAASGEPLPGVSVLAKGTQAGTSTEGDGTYNLDVPSEADSLVFSFVGYEDETVAIAGRSTIDVALRPEVVAQDEVVVTALGIERQERSLGYAVSEVSGEEVSDVPVSNIGEALQGKVAGLDVSDPATGPGGSSRLVIRGISSIQGNNQPLIVVDGIPIDNSSFGQATTRTGGVDTGDALSSINATDIVEVSVLKGASAAALYGQRASNGVVLITTKTGSEGPLGVTFTSNTSFSNVANYYNSFQTEYGHGTNGEVPKTQDAAQTAGLQTWGGRTDSDVMAAGYDGQMRPYTAGDPLGDFYRTAVSTNNSLALTGGNGETTFRLSLNHRSDESIMPNSNLQRTSVLLRGTSSLGIEGLTVDGKANYIREQAENRPYVADSPGSASYTAALFPRTQPIEQLKPGFVTNDAGNEVEFQFTGDQFTTNPYWAINRFVNGDTENRLIGYVKANYAVTDWLNGQVRAGTDLYRTFRETVTPFGTAYNEEGRLNDTQYFTQELNADALVTADKAITESFRVTGRLGAKFRRRTQESTGGSGSNFVIPTLQTVTNLENNSPEYSFSAQEVYSGYGEVGLSYNDYAFINVTGRNDWASTLPVDNNSYFYPSVSGSFIFSDAFEMPNWLNYGKLRGSWAQVGTATNPYRLSLNYGIKAFGHGVRGGDGNVPLSFIQGSEVPPRNLKPSSKTDVEAGIELGFLGDRLSLNATVYRSTTEDNIIPASIATGSGYNSILTNIGETRNTGLELAVLARPITTDDWQWRVSANASTNRNEVVQLAPNVDELTLTSAGSAFIKARKGDPYGIIEGYTLSRDDQGRPILDQNGLPTITDTLSRVGKFAPDWRGGLTNTISFKNFTLDALVDVQIGGDLYSQTNVTATGAGLTEETLRGREDGINVEGVRQTGTDEQGNPIYEETTSTEIRNGSDSVEDGPLRAEDYWGRISGVTERFVYDASYVKLREVTLSYRLPESLIGGTAVNRASIALTGRNLLTLYDNVPNVDPESTFSQNSANQGLEFFGVPIRRTLGIRFNARF
jgi:TonB-linked SusC/RagA family outer membrane protein